MEEDSTLRPPMFIPHTDLIKLPAVEALLENDTATIDQEAWDAVLDDVRLADDEYQASTRTLLWDLVKDGFPLKNSAVELSGEEPSAPAPEECLFFATAVFKCKECPEDRPIWYPNMLRHVHQRGPKTCLSILQSELEPVPELQKIVVRLLKDLDLDLYTPAADLPKEKVYLCACCDERLTSPMDFPSLVSSWLGYVSHCH